MLADDIRTDSSDESDSATGALNLRWGVDSEYGRLTDVMLCVPNHLEPVPCCAATVAALRRGFEHSIDAAVEQHRALARSLELNGVRCHFVPAATNLPDLAFARDATLMTPWGLLELNLAAAHRRDEPGYVARAARAWGVPTLGRVRQGTVEGGDVCIVRPGLVVIGCSGERTDEAGAAALAAIFERHGWRAVIYRFDPHFLHLDTQFTMLDETRALACVDVLSDEFVKRMRDLGIDLVPVTYKEVMRLGANVLSLGDGRVVASADNKRVNLALARLGYEVTAVDIDQFTRCGGGIHCLTMPLAREPVAGQARRHPSTGVAAGLRTAALT